MSLSGPHGDDQPGGDLRVRQSVGDQVGDLELAPGQWGGLGGRRRWVRVVRLRLEGERDSLIEAELLSLAKQLTETLRAQQLACLPEAV